MSAQGEEGRADAPPEPVALTGERIASLDFIRGIAVMGILAANIISMGQPFTASIYPGAFASGHSVSEDWMWAAQFVLIDGKMRGLFTLLFGAGIYLFVEKARAKGASRLLQIRRLLWLGVFGLIHYYLIWRGDILLAYSMAGIVAVLLFIDLEPHKQMVLGVLGFLAGAIFYGVTMVFMQVVADGPEPDSAALAQVQAELLAGAERDLSDGRSETRIWQEGSYGDLVGHTFEQHGSAPFTDPWLLVFETLPLILIGMALYQFGLFTGGMDPRKQRLWGWAGLALGFFLTTIIALATIRDGVTYYEGFAARLGWGYLPKLFMTLGLASLLAINAPKAGHFLADRVSAAGRAAFTNYLGISLVMLFVFGNWGLDLFGRLGRSELYLVTAIAWVVMLAWSKPWLDRFRYGPLEWVWRCLTYGRLFTLRHPSRS